MDIQICSLKELQKMARAPFPEGTALINIDDADAGALKLDNWPAYFCGLRFDDIWSSEIDPENDWTFADRMFSGIQADEIAYFLFKYDGKITTLICQCRSGRSRSAAVAAAVKEYFTHNGIGIFIDEKYSPNVYVFQKTYWAIQGRFEGGNIL